MPADEARDAVVTITYIIVAFSILVQGLSIGTVISKSRIPHTTRTMMVTGTGAELGVG